MFTVGVLAYQMVTGRPPFRAPSLPELMGQMLQVKPATPETFAPSLPPAASAAILRAIDATPGNRFQSAEEFSAALGLGSP